MREEKMVLLKVLSVLFLFSSQSVLANELDNKFHFYLNQIENEEISDIEMYQKFSEFEGKTSQLSQANALKFISLKNELFNVKGDIDGLIRAWIIRVNKFGLSRESAIEMLGFENYLTILNLLNTDNKIIAQEVEREIKEISEFHEPTNEQIQDLFKMNNSHRGISIYVFCRDSRLYPCLMTVKDIYGNPTYDENGNLWAIPVLAKSSRGLEYFQRNGNTPQGVQRIDSVMPYADQFTSFGKWRRLILNFFSNVSQESETLNLLPESIRELNFWKEASVARDAGRSNLRIHGTGKINEDPTSTYYPHRMTSGCISTREGKYSDVDFKDQRVLLDHLMKSLYVDITFANEVLINGTLILIEIDQAEKKVTLDDLALRGLTIRRQNQLQNQF
jgi:hypothetical protein